MFSAQRINGSTASGCFFPKSFSNLNFNIFIVVLFFAKIVKVLKTENFY